jgi:hypothetical protein
MVAASGALPRAHLPSERAFFLWMTIAIGLTVFVGFSRSFFLAPLFPGFPAAREPFFALHGTVFASWFVLLIVQASLVTAGRVHLHRQLGVFGAFLAAAMVVLGTAGGLIAAHRPTGFVDLPVPPLIFLVVPLSEMLLFAVLVTLAIVKRRNPQTHKRLMLIASATLITAALARWPVLKAGGPLVFFAAADLFLVALAIWDFKSRGRLHPVTLWAGSIAILMQPLSLALGGTALWHSFALWATGFVG